MSSSKSKEEKFLEALSEMRLSNILDRPYVEAPVSENRIFKVRCDCTAYDATLHVHNYKFKGISLTIYDKAHPKGPKSSGVTLDWDDVDKLVKVLTKASKAWKNSKEYLDHEAILKRNDERMKSERMKKAGK